MSVKYSWNRQNGAAMPSVRFMSIEPAEDYYKGMPLKLKEKGVVEPTDGDPEYICMAQYDPDTEIQPLEIPVQEVFPDVVYDRMNDDGTIEEVRFGSKGGGGVQSDMYQTDPEALDFVKNNPLESGVVELAFDGELDGKEYVETSMEGAPLYLVRMTKDVLALTDFVAVTRNISGTTETIDINGENIEESDSHFYIANCVILAKKDGAGGLGFETDVAIDKGVWFMVMDASLMGGTGWMGALGLTYKGKQLKPSLLPPHKHKWDDIEDAICYDRSVSEPLNITFDGNIDNYESVLMGEDAYFVKVSSETLTVDDVIGSTLVQVLDGEESELLLTEEYVLDMATHGAPIINVADQMVLVVYGDVSALGMPLSTGVWFVYSEGGSMYIKSLSNPNVTITTGEIKKIDPKFYDQPCYESVQFGNIMGSVDINVSDAWVWHEYSLDNPIKLIVGYTYFVKWDGTLYELKCIDFLGLPFLGSHKYNGAYLIDNNTPFGITGHPDVSFTDITIECDTPGSHTLEIYKGTVITPLPEKFMPELTQVILKSATEGSTKKFRVTVDDTGALTAVEV